MASVKSLRTKNSEASNIMRTVIGRLESISADGIPMVSIAGAEDDLLTARSALADSDYALLTALPVNVVLLLDSNHAVPPIITGIVRDCLPTTKTAIAAEKIGAVTVLSGERDLQVDGKRVTINAEEEILLQCGKSSILLCRDGKIVIKGANLVSRSTGVNKIKGSSININ